MLRDLPTSTIDLRSDARPINDAAVSALADSIAEVGVINPIRVRSNGLRWEVVAGAHRLAACRSIGLAEIPALVVEDDDLHAELAMIDENLCRAELSASDRARHTARRKAIYEELHPETRAGIAGAAAKHGAVDNLSTASFADATADATGRDARSVRRDAERGAKVIDEVLDLVRGTKLDTGTYLDRIKNLSSNDQVQAAKRDLALSRQKDREAASDQAERSRRAKIDGDVQDRAAREIAEILAEKCEPDMWDGIKANLYAAGAKRIADALSNITGQSIMDGRYAA